VHPEYRGAFAQAAPAQGTSQRAPQDEFKIVRKDGEERWVLMSAGAIEFTGKPAIIGTLFDITERKNLEGKLRYAQKMEALGKLAGGVAHDFNNVLTSIVGYGDMLANEVDRTSPLRNHVDKILASSERAAGLVKSLLSFGARVEARLATRDLNEVVLRAERFLAGLLPESIAFAIRTAPGVIAIHADAGKLERVIMNLVLNARDAMPSGGALTVETGIRELDAEFVRAHGFGKLGPHALVAVHDTGTGMDEGVKKRIFEPFFTTKSSGKGTGFGLSIVYDIVKEHDGYITVASEPGKGSSFSIFLPLAQESAAGLEPGPAPAGAGGREKILIVDDDETARKYAAAVLGECGYRVLEAGDGEEAVKKLREAGDGVRLVIMDMTMPRMNGKEACRAIRKIRPDLKVIFVSGYSEDLLLKTGILEQGQHFLMKPVSQQELLRTVRAVLDA
jgi:signal transduction histidine kinase